MSRFLKSLALAACVASPAVADTIGLGRVATDAEIAAWDIDVRPDGLGLPEGRGDVLTGEELFADQCAACHGDFGEAVDRWPVLAGGFDTLDSEDPVKTVGSYWPYLSTVWDYIHRAMPFGNAQSLTNDEVYAITAYVLYVNDLVEDDFELSHENFSDMRLPNEGNFFMDDRGDVEIAAFSAAPCMTNCKDSVEITARARIIDVTPEETAAKETAVETVISVSDKPTEATATTVAAVEEAPAAPALDPDLVAKGEKVFKKCKSCHKVGAGAKNASGPHLNAIVGRVAAGVDGFKYSKALKKAADDGLVWNAETLDQFVLKPKKMIKGTKMSFAGLKKEKDRLALIEYLRSLTEE